MLPNLIIIGAAKAGTTSLHYYLDQHPQVHMARESNPRHKELDYFWRDNWRELRDWYERHFDVPEPVKGEATPAYTSFAFRCDVAPRIYELIPDARLIYVVRDPIDRIRSNWVQFRGDGGRAPFEKFMRHYDRPDNRIVSQSRYWTQLALYLRYFSPEQICVVDQHDLLVARQPTLRRIFRFVGVDEDYESDAFTSEKNTRSEQFVVRQSVRVGGAVLDRVRNRVPASVRPRVPTGQRWLYTDRRIDPPELDAAMRKRLADHLRPEVERLREFTGQAFATWQL